MDIAKILLCVVLISSGQALLKWGMHGLDHVVEAAFKPSVWIAMLCYGIGMLAWLDVLRKTPLHIAYPLIAVSFLLVPLFSMWLLQEKVGYSTIIGGIFIVFGVFISYFPKLNW